MNRARVARRESPWLLASLTGMLASACEPASLSDDDCPEWTRARDDRCVLRPWSVPNPEDALGEPGARDVQVALGGGGHALVAWAQTRINEDGPVVVAEPLAEGWSLTEVSAGTGSGLEPAVALSLEGRALLAWKQQREDGAIYLATRDPEGAWQWPRADAPLSWDETAYEPRVHFGPAGEALVLWNQWTGAHFGVAMSVRPADRPNDPFVAPQGPAQLLSPSVNYANAPRLALGPDGEALVAWYQAPIDDLMVYVSERREPGGAFSQPEASAFLSPAGGPVDSHAQANPWPALHPSGVAAVAWTQQRSEGDLPVYLAVRDAEGTWTRPATLDDSLSPPGAYARCPQLAFGPDGTMLLTWFETRGADTAVFAWRGHSRTDGEVLRLSAEGLDAVHPSLTIGPDGGAVVVWSEGRDGSWQVLARRHQPYVDAWLPAEPLSSSSPGLAPEPQVAIASDDGRVLVAWAQGGVLDGRVLVAELP